jgi:glyoxylase-like metal-dependent hydrolase (beta-lactamase superfamily II)
LIITDTGKVGSALSVLGSSRMPVYLFDGKKPVIFEAGISCLGPAYEKDLLKTLNGRAPEILFLTHVHFDHCGSASYLKKAFPGLTIAGSKQAAGILARPNALELMAGLNKAAAEGMRKLAPELVSDEIFQPFVIDRVLSDGDRLDLGNGFSLEVLATPGHTRDSLSYYLPDQKILIASESGGCLDASGQIITEFLSDYQDYISSIRRLDQLEVEIFCQGHGAVFTGKEAQGFFKRSLQSAAEFKQLVEESLRAEGGDIAKAVGRIKAVEYDPKPQPKQPEPAYLINIEARVKYFARQMEKEPVNEKK